MDSFVSAFKIHQKPGLIGNTLCQLVDSIIGKVFMGRGYVLKMVLGLPSINGYLIKLPALYGNELTPATADGITIDLPFYNNALLPADPSIESSWSHAYAVIYVANAVLKGLSVSTAVRIP